MHAARSPAAAPLGGCARRRAPRSRLQAPTAQANTFGQLFRVTTFGESHGGGVGCVVDGVPPRLRLAASDLQAELDRRRPGRSRITTPRSEEDTCETFRMSGGVPTASVRPCSTSWMCMT